MSWLGRLYLWTSHRHTSWPPLHRASSLSEQLIWQVCVCGWVYLHYMYVCMYVLSCTVVCGGQVLTTHCCRIDCGGYAHNPSGIGSSKMAALESCPLRCAAHQYSNNTVKCVLTAVVIEVMSAYNLHKHPKHPFMH